LLLAAGRASASSDEVSTAAAASVAVTAAAAVLAATAAAAAAVTALALRSLCPAVLVSRMHCSAALLHCRRMMRRRAAGWLGWGDTAGSVRSGAAWSVLQSLASHAQTRSSAATSNCVPAAPRLDRWSAQRWQSSGGGCVCRGPASRWRCAAALLLRPPPVRMSVIARPPLIVAVIHSCALFIHLRALHCHDTGGSGVDVVAGRSASTADRADPIRSSP